MARILIVEDNEMNRDMLSRRLARRGHEVMIAVDGAEGLAAASRAQPDLILMDLSLPVLDGWEAIKRLKADDGLKSIPVIALTAHALMSDRDEVLKIGGDDFDTKPVDFTRLLEKIARLLGQDATQ